MPWHSRHELARLQCWCFLPRFSATALPSSQRSNSDIYGDAEINSQNISDDLKFLCRENRPKEALHTIDRRGIQVEFQTYDLLLQKCMDTQTPDDGKIIHAHMHQTGYTLDAYLGTKLVNLYAKCGFLSDARRVLDGMRERNVVSWTSMIAAYTKCGHGQEALKLYCQMQRDGIQPNEFTFSCVLASCANLLALEHGKEIHGGIIKGGFQSDVYVGNALVRMYVKCGRIQDARKVFDEMPQRNVVSWTVMMGGYAQSGELDEAQSFFQDMPERNLFSWNALITGYAQSGHVADALRLFKRMSERNVVSWNAMIAGCAQNGLVDEALELFEEMPERNVVSWSGMIAGYAQNGLFYEAVKLYQRMHLTGAKPDGDTFASVLSACANLAALYEGREVHEKIIRSGFLSDLFVGNALVDMYAKCGTIEDARIMFEEMPRRDVVSWTALIVGYAMHGCAKEAIQHFKQMLYSGTKPDQVTFVGVLTACCHAGLVDDGWQYFYSLSREYDISPTVEHYCCMVDLLGRAGKLNEARDFINNMPIKPNATVWLSLLGACRVHTNVELGELAAESLFELDPNNAAHYVLLSNIYANAGRWDHVQKVRNMMKERGIKKVPGYSWIEINNVVYSFLGGERAQPQMQAIYAMLDKLSGKMKEEGYVPGTEFVLHDVDEEQKEHILCQHSEKLAIAFGLITTSPGTPIRVIKNLRVCVDCHSTSKFISKIVGREIVVRDASRFHHFKEGQCSCGDYW